MIDVNTISRNLNILREGKPLVHNITNYVVMNNTANALTAIGASPIMAHAIQEVTEIVKASSSVVLNIGTISERWKEAMFAAACIAKANNIPIVFDPVGVGFTQYRTDLAKDFCEHKYVDVICGNASEINNLLFNNSKIKGVDSVLNSYDVKGQGILLSKKYDSVVVITGAKDFIIDKDRIVRIGNGVNLMKYIVGLGCTATAIIGAFIGANDDKFEACCSAMAVMGIAGEMAYEKSQSPGSFQMHFIDALYEINEEQINKRLKIENE